MAFNLLSITQEILGEIGGDDVSSIYDTEESEQVARHVIAVYKNLVSRETWPWYRRATQLDPYSDSNYPVYMSVPTSIKEVLTLRYDCATDTDGDRKKYKDLLWKEPDDFLRYTGTRDNTSSDVLTITDPSGVEFFIRTDCAPTYYTSFDDQTIIMDSYDSDVDSTIQSSKTQVIAYIIQDLEFRDDSVPDMPADTQRLLIEESIARVQSKEKEMPDSVSERESVRLSRTLSRKSWVTNKPTRYPDYGRRSRGRSRHATFRHNGKNY